MAVVAKANRREVDQVAVVGRVLAPADVTTQLAGSTPSGARGFRGLADAVAALITSSRLPLGARMPAERELARAMNLSRTTVSAAYDLLREHGYLRSRQGAGSWITVPIPGVGRSAQPQLSDAFFGVDTIDLTMAAHAAPSEAVLAATARAMDALPRYLSGTGYATFGLDVLREAIADDYRRRGLPTTPEQILVTSGSQQGIDLVLQVTIAPGDRVVVDNPTYPGALDAAAAAHARVVLVDLQTTDAAHEWDVDAYTATVRQSASALAYLIADFHNPTGALMAAEDRLQVVEGCRRAGTQLLVDETLAGLALDDQDQPPPVASFDAAGAVVTVGSVSKSVWGGLRVGWIRADAQLIQRLAIARARSDMAGAVLEQLIVAELLGDHPRLAGQRTISLRAQRDALIAALNSTQPQWRVRKPAGGLVLWVELDAPVSATLAARAAAFGLRLAPGRRFGADVRLDRWLRVPFSQPVEVLEEAVRRLANLTQNLDGAADLTTGRLELIA